MLKDNQTLPQKPALTSPFPIAGKAIQKRFPTPNISDYLVAIRRDTRKSEFKMPAKGDAFDGVDQQSIVPNTFRFATATPIDQLPGFVDLWYAAPLIEQEKYNYTVTWPYVDKNFPRYERTYIVLRTDDLVTKEPSANDKDPAIPSLQLTDHQVKRLEQDPVLDSVFVQVIRVFERLPGPIVTSFESNAHQQVVTVKNQEVARGVPPPEGYFVELTKQERVGTAKAKNTLATVERIFPETDLTKNWGSAYRDPLPIEFRYQVPLKTSVQVVKGYGPDVAVMPDLQIGDLHAQQTQMTDYKKKVSLTHYDVIDVEIDDTRINAHQQVETIHRLLHQGEQTPDSGNLITGGGVVHVGGGATIKTTESIPAVFDEHQYVEERFDSTPPEFKALLQSRTESVTGLGQATEQVLGVGEYRRSSENKTIYSKRDSVTSRDVGSLPRSLTDFATTNADQFESIKRTLELSGVSTATPDELTKVFLRQLGDGTELEEIRKVPSLFTAKEFMVERQDPVPQKFRIAFPITATGLLEVGDATLPSLTTGDLMQSEKQETVFTKRSSRRFRDLAMLPITLHSKETNKDQQIVFVDETLRLAGNDPSPTATIAVTVDALGDGTVVEVLKDNKTVFGAREYAVERQDPTPLKFRLAFPITSTGLTEIGDATLPILATGDLAASEKQETTFIKRSSRRFHNLAALPITLQSKETNKEKQVVFVSETLRVAGTDPLPTATTSVAVDALGDGTFVETVKDNKVVFGAGIAEVSIPEMIPKEFMGLAPKRISSVTSEGIANMNPALGFGEVMHREEQVDVFNKRVTTDSLAGVSLPAELIDQELTTQFGGGITDIIRTLDGSPLTVDQGLRVVGSKVLNLANGLYLRETQRLINLTWAPIHGTHVDERYGIAVGITKQTVPEGTVGGVFPDGSYVEVRPRDIWKSISIASKLDPNTLPAPRTWETTANHSFPHELLAAQFIEAQAWNSNNYAFAMSLLTDIRQGYSGPCRALLTESFTLGPPTDQVAVTQFFPQRHTVGYAWAYWNKSTVKAHSQTWVIPPTLHDTIVMNQGIAVAQNIIRTITDGSIHNGSNIITSPTASFTSSDVGAFISGVGLPVVTQNINGTIVQIPPRIIQLNSPTSVTISTNATATATESMVITNNAFRITNSLPATTPISLPHGQLMTKKVDVEVWRLNVFFRRHVQIYVP